MREREAWVGDREEEFRPSGLPREAPGVDAVDQGVDEDGILIPAADAGDVRVSCQQGDLLQVLGRRGESAIRADLALLWASRRES
jgi:hypothetical protein